MGTGAGNTGGQDTKQIKEQAIKEYLAQQNKEFGLDATQGNYKEEYVSQIGFDPGQIKETINGVVKATTQGLTDQSVFTTLDEQATQVSNSFGIAKGRMEEFKQVILNKFGQESLNTINETLKYKLKRDLYS